MTYLDNGLAPPLALVKSNMWWPSATEPSAGSSWWPKVSIKMILPHQADHTARIQQWRHWLTHNFEFDAGALGYCPFHHFKLGLCWFGFYLWPSSLLCLNQVMVQTLYLFTINWVLNEWQLGYNNSSVMTPCMAIYSWANLHCNHLQFSNSWPVSLQYWHNRVVSRYLIYPHRWFGGSRCPYKFLVFFVLIFSSSHFVTLHTGKTLLCEIALTNCCGLTLVAYAAFRFSIS